MVSPHTLFIWISFGRSKTIEQPETFSQFNMFKKDIFVFLSTHNSTWSWPIKNDSYRVIFLFCFPPPTLLVLLSCSHPPFTLIRCRSRFPYFEQKTLCVYPIYSSYDFLRFYNITPRPSVLKGIKSKPAQPLPIAQAIESWQHLWKLTLESWHHPPFISKSILTFSSKMTI